jgi:hypothetical protein
MYLLPARLRDPVIADRTVDLMAAAYWLCYAGWGIASTIAGLNTVTNASSLAYTDFWGGSIGVLGLVAFVATVGTFVNSRDIEMRIRKKVAELVCVCILGGFVSLYPLLLLIAAIGGDATRIAPFFAAVSYVIFPMWRVRHLFFRISKLREVVATRAAVH